MAVFTAVPFDQFKAGVARGPADVTASLQRNVERTSPNERAKQQQTLVAINLYSCIFQ